MELPSERDDTHFGTPATPHPRAQLSTGTVIGRTDDRVDRFLGIPYAAPPFGENRFQAPQPVAPWHTPREAAEFGPTSPQNPYIGGVADILPLRPVPGEDILTLSVWAPHRRPERALPVFVWVHGGDLAHGSHAQPVYDGTGFAEDDVITVGVNYRLGAEGFMLIEDAPDNRGLLDIVAALEWVQREIPAFGGDPGAVTIGGSSTGGQCVYALLRTPAVHGLVHGAVIQSAPLIASPRSAAQPISDLIARQLHAAATVAELSGYSAEEVLAAQQSVLSGSAPITGRAEFHVVDTGLVAEDEIPVDIPILIGTNTEEYRLWLVPDGQLSRINWLVARYGYLRYGISNATAALFRRTYPNTGAAEIFGLIATDFRLRAPMCRFATRRARRGAAVFVYEFGWRTAQHRLGATHAAELGFVFDTLDSADSVAIAGPTPPASLAARMHGDWGHFVSTGDPLWPRWDDNSTVQYYDALANPVHRNWREAETQAVLADLTRIAARRTR